MLEFCIKALFNYLFCSFQNVLGRSSSVVYAVALLASGQSTTISCTFAGQVIMQVTFPNPGVIQFIYTNYSKDILKHYLFQ